MRKLFFLTFILLSGLVFSQPENAPVETINGKKYYVHIVEQGNTLYGIQTLYKTNMDAILNANPGLTDNLAIGQKILIPVANQSVSENYGIHIVAQGETLYGISKKYKCTVEQLLALNPGVENGLSIGQKLNIPISETLNNSTEQIQTDPVQQYEITYTDSVVKHTVLEHETLYSIARRYMVTTDTIQTLNNLEGVKVKKGDVLIIPVKKMNYEILEKEILPIDNQHQTNQGTYTIVREPVYTVALLLPLMLSQNDAEMAKPLKIDQVRELYPTTKMNFEFYQGFVMAADSLKAAGLSVDIYVYDTKKDSATIVSIFSKDEFKNVDLVVGPMFQNEVDVTAKLCQEKNIPMVIPFKVDAAVLNQNPMVYKTVSSTMTLFDGAVDYMLEHHYHHNVLVVKPGSGDLTIFDRCVARYNSGIKLKSGYMNDHIIEVLSGSNSGRDLETYIKKDTINVVLVPSENIKFVAGVFSRLNSVMNSNYRSTKMKIIIFGIQDWNKYDDVDMAYRNRLLQHYSSYRFVDYNQGQGKEFVKAFRKRFGTDPTVFATQGFDIGMYFLGALHLYGKNFDPFLSGCEIELVQNRFVFKPVAEGSGKENVRTCVVKYQDYELYKLAD
ncbi:MAG: LysM peptidoglycan-binding domain-containing protein [Crocinitomicaceae bacterium]|nr:LysM peptidoglycan-binding domain-containing protein [Crocinitomicaceae bacterium]